MWRPLQSGLDPFLHTGCWQRDCTGDDDETSASDDQQGDKESGMQPNLMRKIDYYIGRPVCWLLTVLYKCQRLIGLQDPYLKSTPKNVLFIELAEMGSTVVAYPAINAMKRMYPYAKIHFVLFKQIEDSLKLFKLIPQDNVLTIDSTSGWSLVRDTMHFAWRCRKRKIDTAIVLETFTRYGTILGYLSGAKKRVGFFGYHQKGLYIGDFLSHKVLYNPHLHMSHAFMTLVHALQAPAGETPLSKVRIDSKDIEVPKINSSQAALENIWTKLKTKNNDVGTNKKIVLVNPNASQFISIRKWPLDNYLQLIQKLLQDDDVYTVITGAKHERPEADYLVNAINSNRVLNLCGETSLTELIHLFNIGNLLISNDSGPAHFAALTDIHVVVLFGPESPAVYQPLASNCTVLYANYACSPCVSAFNQRLSPCNDNVCLKSIQVEEVYHTVCKILSAGSDDDGAPQ